MADPTKTAKHIIDRFLSEAGPAGPPNYHLRAKDRETSGV
jgi:hypothetical protein